MIDVVMDVSLIYNYPQPVVAPVISYNTSGKEVQAGSESLKVDTTDLQQQHSSGNNQTDTSTAVNAIPLSQISNSTSASSVIYLNNGTVIFLKHVSSSFALVCLLRAEHFTEKRQWIEVNFEKFKDSIRKIFYFPPSALT